jgi:outer membrane receptor for ferrienterochelin and colicin
MLPDAWRTFRLTITLDGDRQRRTWVVTGQRGNAKIDKRGVGASFSERNIRDMPTANNDFKEVINQSPLANHELAGNNSTQSNQPLSIAGANPRCNSFNVDGVSQGDSFGLNSGGYPTARSPLPYNWTKQIQVAVSPYDTEYNDFCGGIINVITKTGENEFHGGSICFKDQDLHSKTSATHQPAQDRLHGRKLGRLCLGSHHRRQTLLLRRLQPHPGSRHPRRIRPAGFGRREHRRYGHAG